MQIFEHLLWLVDIHEKIFSGINGGIIDHSSSALSIGKVRGQGQLYNLDIYCRFSQPASLLVFSSCSWSWSLFSLTVKPPLHFIDVSMSMIWYFCSNKRNIHLNMTWTGVIFYIKAVLTCLVFSLDFGDGCNWSSWDGTMCMFSPLTPLYCSPTTTTITISCPITPS